MNIEIDPEVKLAFDKFRQAIVDSGKVFVTLRDTVISAFSKDELERFYKKERNRKRYYRMMERRNTRKR